MLTNDYHKIIEYYLETSRGNIVGAKSIHKFGLAGDVDPSDGLVDVWDGVSNGAGGDHRPYRIPIAFNPGARLGYKAQSLSNNTAISAGFHGVLIKGK